MNTLDDFRKQAKHWLREIQQNNPGPVKRLRLAYPGAPETPGLRDVQHALAREEGFESWKALITALQKGPLATSAAAPGPPTDHAGRVVKFLEWACWDHREHGRAAYAMTQASAIRLLRKHPEIARDSLYTAVVCGEAEEVERILTQQPELANRKGGPRRWEPLLYLCYGRLSADAAIDNAVTIARVLLDRGADPNVYYPAGDAIYGTLVGVAGEGEQEAPPHPRREALYELLLERGAEPYDIQVLYNTHFRGDVLWWLTLTYAHATKTGRLDEWKNPDWPMLDMAWYGSGARFLFRIAIEEYDVELARWLLEHGANPNAAPARAPGSSKRSLYDEAAYERRPEIAELLRQHGATSGAPVLDDRHAFVDACVGLDRTAVDAQLKKHPEYLTSPEAIFAAAQRDRDDVVAFLLDLGTPIDVEDEHRQRPLHVAAANNACRAAAFLIERGASPDVRETRWNATPLGYAFHHDHRAMIDLLVPVSRDIWTLGYLGMVDRLRAVLSEDPTAAREVTRNGVTPLWSLPNDEARAVEVAELLLEHGADPSVRSKEGRTAAHYARERGLDAAADKLEARLGP